MTNGTNKTNTRDKTNAGFHTTARELQTCTFQGPCASKTPPKFHVRTPKREKKERKLWRGGKKSAKFWASHPSGPHLFKVWAPTFRGPPGSRPTPFAHHSRFGRLPFFILSKCRYFVPFPFFFVPWRFFCPGPRSRLGSRTRPRSLPPVSNSCHPPLSSMVGTITFMSRGLTFHRTGSNFPADPSHRPLRTNSSRAKFPGVWTSSPMPAEVPQLS